MTSSDITRRPSRRPLGRRVSAPTGVNGRSEVGEKLRDARELRGVDLFRVERDTKIRSKFLADLEEGDYADLPGDVYTRGFLRNYATYLGLDPDEIEEEWRQEAGEMKPLRPALIGPQPLTISRRMVFQQSHLVIAVVVVIVLVVATYFGFQLSRYLSYPTLAVDAAGPTPVTVPLGTTNYVLKGNATPGTTVLIAWNGNDPKTVIADDSGVWTFQAVLQAGPNQFDITAKNLDTSHASGTVRMIINVPVPTPTPLVPQVAFMSPADGATVANGNVTVTGNASDVSSVTLTPTWLGPPLAANATIPPPTASPSAPAAGSSVAPSGSTGPSPTPGPQPTSVSPGADGTFTFTLKLGPGRWQLVMVGADAKGARTGQLLRTVNVPYTGVNVVVQVKGAPSWLKYFKDGVAVDSSIYPDGWTATVVGKSTVCLYAGAPGSVVFTANGNSYGPISSFGGQRVLIDVNGPKYTSQC